MKNTIKTLAVITATIGVVTVIKRVNDKNKILKIERKQLLNDVKILQKNYPWWQFLAHQKQPSKFLLPESLLACFTASSQFLL